MPVYRRGKGWQVAVRLARAEEGYRNIRKQVSTEGEALALDVQITHAVNTYGHWPVRDAAVPLTSGNTTQRHGTLHQVAEEVIEVRWGPTRWGKTAKYTARVIVRFMEARGRADLDDILTDDVQAYVTDCRHRGLKEKTIKTHISVLKTLYTSAMDRVPQLCQRMLPLPVIKAPSGETWWLRPEDQDIARTWLHNNAEFMFADYVDTVAYTGLRIEEALRLAPRHLTALTGDKPVMKVPGEKNKGSAATIPILPKARPILVRAVQRAETHGWPSLFPMTWKQASGRWAGVRSLLGADEIATATMRSLRRSFAHYANQHGVPTATLQRVMRHGNIATTALYLNLVGGTNAEDARRYFEDVKPKEDHGGSLASAINAYTATGASPEEVAQFTKALMSPSQ